MNRIRKIIASIIVVVMIIQLPCTAGFISEAAGSPDIELSGVAHIQKKGNVEGAFKDTVLYLGTTGESKRLESVTINLVNNTGYKGSIEYRVHRQTYSWTDWVSAGNPAGTEGEGKRLEAIQLRLTGELAKHYSIRYRVHIQTYGWKQGWQYDGAVAGTCGEGKRLEALEVQIIPKEEIETKALDVLYRVHRQTYGWEDGWKIGGKMSGTTGQSKRLEGITISIVGNKYGGGIRYVTHVQSYGWMEVQADGLMSGTQGEAKRLEAIEIALYGPVSELYDVYYRVHSEKYGWLGWAKNGEPAGTSGESKRLEAVEIKVVPKDDEAPGSTENSYVDGSKKPVPVITDKVPDEPKPEDQKPEDKPEDTKPEDKPHEHEWVYHDAWDIYLQEAEPTQGSKLRCWCGEWFDTEEEANEHSVNNLGHGNIVPETYTDYNNMTKAHVHTLNKNFTCDICGRHYDANKIKNAYRTCSCGVHEHMSTVYGGYKCDECGKYCINSSKHSDEAISYFKNKIIYLK